MELPRPTTTASTAPSKELTLLPNREPQSNKNWPPLGAANFYLVAGRGAVTPFLPNPARPPNCLRPASKLAGLKQFGGGERI